MRRRAGLVTLMLALAACCERESSVPGAELSAQIDTALARGGLWLVAARGQDGLWRSERYRVLADGWAASLPALKTLAYAPSLPGAREAFDAGLERVLAAAERGDLAHEGLAYPVYEASLAVLLLARPDAHGSEREGAARATWLAHLTRHQCDAALGWSPADLAFGGFGGGPLPPRKDGAQLIEPDLSSTLFALGALRAAGVGPDDARVRDALGFVLRCQNLPLDDDAALDAVLDPFMDDGGFFLSPSDPSRNKAGDAGVDAEGRLRGTSYASASADGLRALLAAGLSPGHPRVVAARRWLETRFDAERNAGDFPPERAVERDAAYYYGAWSAAHAFTRLGPRELASPAGPRAWAEPLARALLARQGADGAWRNDTGVLMEDDPLVATPFALAALALCRLALAGD